MVAGGYAPDRLLLLDGEDENDASSILDNAAQPDAPPDSGGAWAVIHSELREFGHLFVREMPRGCPPALPT